MIIEFDARKNARNIELRGLSFERVAEIDFSTALIYQDERKDYGEIRFIALAYLDHRLHILCFTEILDGIRVISFRKANKREALRHGKPQNQAAD